MYGIGRPVSYELSRPAVRDLEEILRFRAEVAGLSGADRLRRDLLQFFELIGSQFAPGAAKPEWAHPDYRFALKHGYWVIWRPKRDIPGRKVIVKIIDARRDVPRHLAELEE